MRVSKQDKDSAVPIPCLYRTLTYLKPFTRQHSPTYPTKFGSHCGCAGAGAPVGHVLGRAGAGRVRGSALVTEITTNEVGER